MKLIMISKLRGGFGFDRFEATDYEFKAKEIYYSFYW